jgi:hypothetical protein
MNAPEVVIRVPLEGNPTWAVENVQNDADIARLADWIQQDEERVAIVGMAHLVTA